MHYEKFLTPILEIFRPKNVFFSNLRLVQTPRILHVYILGNAQHWIQLHTNLVNVDSTEETQLALHLFSKKNIQRVGK